MPLRSRVAYEREIEITRSTKRLERKLSAAHKKAIVEALKHAFPELLNNRIIIFIEGDNMDPTVENSEIISELISNNGSNKVKRVELSDFVSEFRKKASEELQLHPIVLEMVFRLNCEPLNVSVETVESLVKELSGKLSAGMNPVSASIGAKQSKSSGASAKMDLTLAQLQRVVIDIFVEVVMEKVKSESGKIFFVEYTPTISFKVLRAVADRVKTKTSMYVFVDKGIYLDKEVVEIMNKSSSVVLVSDSLSRYRKLAYSYLRALRDECLGRTSAMSFKLAIGRKEIEEFGTFLDYIIRTGFDMTLVHKVLTYIDSAPGVIFKVLREIVVDMYVRFKKMLPNIEEMLDMKGLSMETALEELSKDVTTFRMTLHMLLKSSIRKVAREYATYSVEVSEEVYKHYMNILEEMTGVRKEILAKVLYILSMYAKLQRSLGSVVILSDEPLLQRAKNLLTPEEMKELEERLTIVIDALKRIGFVNVKTYLGTHVITIQRPLLLDVYAKHLEKEFPRLKQIKKALVSDLLYNTWIVPAERLVRKVFGRESKIVLKQGVIIDRKMAVKIVLKRRSDYR